MSITLDEIRAAWAEPNAEITPEMIGQYRSLTSVGTGRPPMLPWRELRVGNWLRTETPRRYITAAKAYAISMAEKEIDGRPAVEVVDVRRQRVEPVSDEELLREWNEEMCLAGFYSQGDILRYRELVKDRPGRGNRRQWPTELLKPGDRVRVLSEHLKTFRVACYRHDLKTMVRKLPWPTEVEVEILAPRMFGRADTGMRPDKYGIGQLQPGEHLVIPKAKVPKSGTQSIRQTAYRCEKHCRVVREPDGSVRVICL